MVCSSLEFHREQKFRICPLFLSSPDFLDRGISKIVLFAFSWSDPTVYRHCWAQAQQRESPDLQDSQPWSRNKNERIATLHSSVMKTFQEKRMQPYTTYLSWTWMSQNETSPRPRNAAITCQSVHLSSTLRPGPLLTWCLPPKRLTSVAPEGSISHAPREGLRPCTRTDRLTPSGWRSHKSRGPAFTQQRKSLCLWGITPIPIRKKGHRGEEAYSLIDQKNRPSENRHLCHDHLRKGRTLSTFFAPQTRKTCALTLSSQIHRNRPELRALYQRPALRGWLPEPAATPNICTHIPKMFPLRCKGCKFLSCGILSKQTAVNCALQQELWTQPRSPHHNKSLRCRIWLHGWLGQRSKLSKCKYTRGGGGNQAQLRQNSTFQDNVTDT